MNDQHVDVRHLWNTKHSLAWPNTPVRRRQLQPSLASEPTLRPAVVSAAIDHIVDYVGRLPGFDLRFVDRLARHLG